MTHIDKNKIKEIIDLWFNGNRNLARKIFNGLCSESKLFFEINYSSYYSIDINTPCK